MTDDWNMPHGKGEWKPDTYLTECCRDMIWSARPGHFSTCKCGEAFVDQTEYYTRVGGKAKLVEEEELEKPRSSGKNDNA
jgi:hypothetical protein